VTSRVDILFLTAILLGIIVAAIAVFLFWSGVW
jgi:hypothetical protein